MMDAGVIHALLGVVIAVESRGATIEQPPVRPHGHRLAILTSLRGEFVGSVSAPGGETNRLPSMVVS